MKTEGGRSSAPLQASGKDYDRSRANKQIGSKMLHFLGLFLIGPTFLATVWFATIAAYGVFAEMEKPNE